MPTDVSRRRLAEPRRNEHRHWSPCVERDNGHLNLAGGNPGQLYLALRCSVWVFVMGIGRQGAKSPSERSFHRHIDYDLPMPITAGLAIILLDDSLSKLGALAANLLGMDPHEKTRSPLFGRSSSVGPKLDFIPIIFLTAQFPDCQ